MLLSPLENDAELMRKGQFKSCRAAVLQRLEDECPRLSGKAQPLPLVNVIAGTIMQALCCILPLKP